MVKVNFKFTKGFHCFTKAIATVNVAEGKHKARQRTARATARSIGLTPKEAFQKAQKRAGDRATEIVQNRIFDRESQEKTTSSSSTPLATDLSFQTTISTAAPTILTYSNYTGICFGASNTITLNVPSNEYMYLSILCIGAGGYVTSNNFDSGLASGGAILISNLKITGQITFTINITDTISTFSQSSSLYCQGYAASGMTANTSGGKNTFSNVSTQIFKGGNGGAGGNSTPQWGYSTTPNYGGINLPFLPPISGSTSNVNFYIGGGGGGSFFEQNRYNNASTFPGKPGLGYGGQPASTSSTCSTCGSSAYTNFAYCYGAGAGGANTNIGNHPLSSPGCVILYFEGSIDQ